MTAHYTVDFSLDDCLARLTAQQRAIRLENGYDMTIAVRPVPVGTGQYRVEVTRTIRGWRRGRRSAVYVFLKRTGGTITQVRISNTDQPAPLILGALLFGFGIIFGFRGLYALAALCLTLGAVMLIILWMLYRGRLVPRELVKLVQQVLPARP